MSKRLLGESHINVAQSLNDLAVLYAKRYVLETGKSLSPNNTDRGNAIALNTLLIDLGLQTKNTTGDPVYLPTEEGKPFSKLVLQEAKNNNKTCHQLRWYPSVIEKIAA
jgi:hypothetical protein